MPYIELNISGNENFGGYLSVDGSSSVEITNEAVYELSAGQHLFEIHSTSDSDRNRGKFQAKINNAAYTGDMIDLLAGHQAAKAIGDNWSFSVVVEENDCVELMVLTKGNKIIADPKYRVSEMPAEKREYYEQMFQEIHEEEERIANTPRRSKKQIVWGLIITALFGFGMMNAVRTGAETAAILVMAAGIAVGALLFVLGMRKKVRK